MKVLVDNSLSVSLFGVRGGVRPDEVRYYYQVVGYDGLVLVMHGDDYVGWQSKVGVALFNFETIRGDLICRQFPKAPMQWASRSDIVQCTVRKVDRLPPGRPTHLSQAVRHTIGGPG